MTYEGYGPGGRRRLRRGADRQPEPHGVRVRHVFQKSDGSLGESGSVAWLFDRTGLLVVDEDVDEDELTLAAADGGADDVMRDGSVFQVTCAPDDLADGQAARSTRRGSPSSRPSSRCCRRRRWWSTTRAPPVRSCRLIEALEDLDDVQDVYANFDIPDAVLEAAAG